MITERETARVQIVALCADRILVVVSCDSRRFECVISGSCSCHSKHAMAELASKHEASTCQKRVDLLIRLLKDSLPQNERRRKKAKSKVQTSSLPTTLTSHSAITAARLEGSPCLRPRRSNSS